jgi:hypothetical protein
LPAVGDRASIRSWPFKTLPNRFRFAEEQIKPRPWPIQVTDRRVPERVIAQSGFGRANRGVRVHEGREQSKQHKQDQRINRVSHGTSPPRAIGSPSGEVWGCQQAVKEEA